MQATVPMLVTVALLAAGCGQDEPTVTPPPVDQAVTPSPTPEGVTAEPPPVDCQNETITGEPEATIRQLDNSFSPDCLVVLGGQSLVIENQGSAKHNLTIEGTSVDIDTAPGETTRTEAVSGAVPAGTHEFFCKYHRALGMDGEITVSEAG